MSENVTGKVVLQDFVVLARDLGAYIAVSCKKLYVKIKAAMQKADKDKDEKSPEKDDKVTVPKEKYT